MKLRIGALLLSSCMLIAACKKDAVNPNVETSQAAQSKGAVSGISTQGTNAINPDTIGDNVKGFLRLQLSKDSINSDNVLIAFSPSAKTKYVGGEDAPTLQGFGAVSLSSFSSDGIALAINTLPLTNKGLKIGLKVNANTTGVYSLQMKTISAVPPMYAIWLIDKYKNDSLQYQPNYSYAFNISTTDTASFGSNRFKLVIRTR
jgi:hypothetical protein